MSKFITVSGIATINYEVTLDPSVFTRICKENNLDFSKAEEFTEADWNKVRTDFKDNILDYIEVDGQNDTNIASVENPKIDGFEIFGEKHLEVIFYPESNHVYSVKVEDEEVAVKV